MATNGTVKTRTIAEQIQIDRAWVNDRISERTEAESELAELVEIGAKEGNKTFDRLTASIGELGEKIEARNKLIETRTKQEATAALHDPFIAAGEAIEVSDADHIAGVAFALVNVESEIKKQQGIASVAADKVVVLRAAQAAQKTAKIGDNVVADFPTIKVEKKSAKKVNLALSFGRRSGGTRRTKKAQISASETAEFDGIVVGGDNADYVSMQGMFEAMYESGKINEEDYARFTTTKNGDPRSVSKGPVLASLLDLTWSEIESDNESSEEATEEAS